MTSWIHDVTEVVRAAPNAVSGWPSLLSVCEKARPSELWRKLPRVFPKRDVREAIEWLEHQFRRPDLPKPVRGLYLGLNTLNMEESEPFNVEIGATARCDPSGQDTEWPWRLEWHGESHFVRSLGALKRVYASERWSDLYDIADYGIFLGYTGLVLAEALARAEGPTQLIVVWGFCDGDLFFLLRRDGVRVERIGSVL